MQRLWDSVTEPLLDAARPDILVEIGADEGGTTGHLLRWCRRSGTTLHVIDPRPGFDPATWRADHGDVGVLHLERSLNALARIEGIDVALIDGDHNYFTVLHELRLLSKRQPVGSGAFPLVLLHDIHWPYGRRDLYYDPEAIPEAYRKPYRRLGLRPDVAEPTVEGGFNAHLCNGLYENDLDNGVLTAIEDFLAEEPDDLELIQLPGLHGLGVLRDPASHPAGGAVACLLRELTPGARQYAHTQVVERDRLSWVVRFREEQTARRAAEEAASEQATLRHEFEATQRAACADVADLRARLWTAERELEDARQHVEKAEARADDLATRVDEATARADDLATRVDEATAHADDLATRVDEATARADAAERAQHELHADLAQARSSATESERRARSEAAAVQQWRQRARWLEGEVARVRGRKVVRYGLATANALGVLLRTGQRPGRAPQEPPRRAGTDNPTTVTPARSIGPDSMSAESRRDGPERRTTPVRTVQPVGADLATPGTGQLVQPAHANIVIPVHDALDDVRRCLEAVAEHTNLRAHKVVLVDDGSGPETAAALKEAALDLGAELIRRESAGGFGVAASAGIEASWLPAVVLLNSDTVVGPGWLDRLLACAQSDPRVGIVGPWSNAASWQSIPEVTSTDGTWSTNDRIEPGDVPAINERLAREGVHLRPRVPLVNGFCYLVTRELLDVVGSLDTDSFPRGYGEEDDLSIRASEAGFTAAIADDCFVYHAKSASYTPERRDATSRTSQRRLTEKHGETAIKHRTRQMRFDRQLVRARSHAARLVSEGPSVSAIPPPGPSVVWIQPHLRLVGGIRRALEMTNRLATAGWDVTLVSLDAANDPEWLPRRAKVMDLAQARTGAFDVALVSDPDVVWALGDIDARTVLTYHLDAYHLYREHGVEEYYALARKVGNLANSQWTASRVGAAAGVTIDDVVPGAVDLRQFAPRPATVDHDVICYGSRRPRKRTPLAEQASQGLRLGKLVELSASQGDLSWQYSRSGVFVSTSSQEGFNLPCLEAMACGVPVVCTDDGGSREYVVDGHNALVATNDDPAGVRARIDEILDDQALAAQLIGAGLETAAGMDWDRVTAQLAGILEREA